MAAESKPDRATDMNQRFRISDPEVSMRYWQALITFGEEALNKILSCSPWRERFPNLTERARSLDYPTMRAASDTVLPGDLVYELAGSQERRYDFYTNPEGIRIYSRELPDNSYVDREGKRTHPKPKISAQEALLEFGAYALFYSVDNMYGERWFRDPDSENPD